MRRRRAIGEVVSAAIILGGTAIVATLMLSAFSEQSQIATEDLRSRLDILRAQAIEQLDVTGTEWRAGGHLTFLVSNFGDYPTTIPFELYRENGTRVTDENVGYFDLDGTTIMSCTASTPCSLYGTELSSKSAVRLQMPWPSADPLIIITDTGKAIRVSVN